MELTERYPHESGRDYAKRVIRDKIISLELEPGTAISDLELAAWMNLSRTPVREALLDLEYSEDSQADVDMNCVMDEDGNLIEVQATAEGHTYTMEQQQELLELCKKGVERMTQMQRRILWRML